MQNNLNKTIISKHEVISKVLLVISVLRERDTVCRQMMMLALNFSSFMELFFRQLVKHICHGDNRCVLEDV